MGPLFFVSNCVKKKSVFGGRKYDIRYRENDVRHNLNSDASNLNEMPWNFALVQCFENQSVYKSGKMASKRVENGAHNFGKPMFLATFAKNISVRGLGISRPACITYEQQLKTMQEQTEHIFKRNYKKMYLLAKALLRDGDAAKDVVSDVFVDIAGGKLEVLPETEESFLLICVKNRCMNVLNHTKVEEKVEKLMIVETETDEEPAERLIDKLESVLVFIRDGLTPQTGRIINMHYRKKMTYKDIAQNLGISEAAVYKHLAQGINKLKQHFNP